MTIDQAGLDFIRNFEGFSANVYKDVAGHPAIGIGHLIKPNEDFSMGITLEQAQTLLYDDLEGVEAHILQLAPGSITQNQFNSLASFGFNLGVGALAQMLAHGWDQVPQQILRWDHSGGQVVAGLTRRRQAEAALFQS